jgi:glutathione synthase/RimK-type ligase-like ATP-grasp enzyme
MTIQSIPKSIQTLFYLLIKTNFKGLSFQKDNTVVWLRIWGIKYLFDDEIIQNLALINALSEAGIRFRVQFSKKIGLANKQNVLFRYSRFMDPYAFRNYSQSLHFITEQLEVQGCFVYPRSNEVLYWENKGYMTRKFFELNVSTPKTILITNPSSINKIDLPFPFLIKEEHSFSSFGLHQINNLNELSDFIERSQYFMHSKFLIAQELLNMRKDLRVILVGNKIVHHYWRINLSDQWKPTSTSQGSQVDFGNFPEHWRQFIIDEFKKLNLTTGAFDIAWRNDDLTTTPLILEVSPSYQPNPSVDLTRINYPYGLYKKKFLWRNSYDKKYVDIVFTLVKEQIMFLKESSSFLKLK